MIMSDLPDIQRRVLRWAAGRERIDRINAEVVDAIITLEKDGYVTWSQDGTPLLTTKGDALVNA